MPSTPPSGFQPRNILLFGATGNIGKFILDAIVNARDDFSRVVVFTSPASAQSKASFFNDLKTNRRVEVITGDITNEKDVTEAYKGIDTVISALGRTVIEAQIPLIRLADQASDVKWFLPSEYGTDIKYSPASASEKPHQGKLKVRAFLENETKDLAYTYVVTGPYPEMYIKGFPMGREVGGWDVKGKKATLLGEKGLDPVSFTTMKDVGTLVLATLRHPSASFNRALKVNSFTTTPAAIQAEFEKQTGGQPWTDVQYTPLPRLRELEQQAWAQGSPSAAGCTLRRIWTEGGTLYEKRDNDVIGNPKLTTLEELVKDIVSSQGAKL
ncbi:isoflavone reductase family protein [Paecilomyces variotii]|uniref:Isoflavone reductase family protein n=1 Tax=Byssochlamys spectabilis TaxID=264951 RepID=A0A443I0G7_BYSSP|nr:isoflavone reductase family protein [Paecilomyces variotii]KAJ9244080.1 hypothetical protein DTO169E5_2068 [Paecilomyces variotii]KAJ9291640.1 hypothetical protein DTO021C3_997 [Paecilomyces variotii]KAJ9319586.1 hypothetical protein DTO271D3_355 [Paecilomyces variotii]KAJ9365070.1 hypothetical protein DTO280E4_725 [Paecilomyces variotii]KAJ9369033.1 hypothetical protein DTO282E5_6242 [Paecilomyces variotii]